MSDLLANVMVYRKRLRDAVLDAVLTDDFGHWKKVDLAAQQLTDVRRKYDDYVKTLVDGHG